MKSIAFPARLAFLTFVLASLMPARGQWLTQANILPPGWSAVYFNVDASAQLLDTLVGSDPANPIDQIWPWKTAAGSAQYIHDPGSPLSAGGRWDT